MIRIQPGILSVTVFWLTIFSCYSSFAQSQNEIKQNKNKLFNSLDAKGITFGISESLEGYYNFRGGIRKGSAFASTLDANMNIDLQKLLRISGGTFYTDPEYHAGDNPTNTLVGDFQVFDKHSAMPFFQVLEIWYQQRLFHNMLRIKIGKIDANAEFSVIDNGLEFINSSTQVTPTLFVFPTFPDPMPAVNIFFYPGHLFYTGFAVFDANSSDRFLNFYGDPESVQPTQHGQLVLSESGFTWDHLFCAGKDGNLKIGLWKHTGTFKKFDHSIQHSTEGIYLIMDQTLWKPSKQENTIRGIRMFLEYARSDASVAPIDEHAGGGVTWTGLSADRPEDVTGFSLHYGRLSPALKLNQNHELNLETFYKVNIAPWLNIKPDLQYIVHPGGQYPNALVGILLLNFSFNS